MAHARAPRRKLLRRAESARAQKRKKLFSDFASTLIMRAGKNVQTTGTVLAQNL